MSLCHSTKCFALLVAAAALLFIVPSAAAPRSDVLQALRQRSPQDEIIYFLLPDRFENGDRANDRGGLKGDRLHTGFDPTSKAFYNGGDFKGVMKRLDYIQSLGATAVWMAPVFKNKPVQGPKGDESAGYHGYWITDFTHVDPHFGSDAEFKKLVDAVHARGMKFYMDIVVNHTADVIQYRECTITNIVNEHSCAYRSRADYPYTREGGVDGKPINPGFLGDEPQYQTPENFAKLTNPDYAYQVYIPKGEEHEKVPDWLNNPIYYHNRGNSTFENESSTMGDFGGLDDLYTENPRVVQGMIDIFGAWIDKYGVDGFRIDTEQHRQPGVLAEVRAGNAGARQGRRHSEFPHLRRGGDGRRPTWPRMPAILARTAYPTASIIPSPRRCARWWPASADLTSWHACSRTTCFTRAVSHGRGTCLPSSATMTRADSAISSAQAFPNASDDEVMKRVILAQAMMFTLRGVPTVYYGDEQGFPGTGGDQAAREDMFASKVALYNSEKLIGSNSTTAVANFNENQPIYRAIAELAHLRSGEFRAAARQADRAQLFGQCRACLQSRASIRIRGREILIAFNTSTAPLDVQVEIDRGIASVSRPCTAAARRSRDAPGSYHVSLKPLDYVVCAARDGR